MAVYRESSRREWVTKGKNGTDEEIKVGCLQRIADGVEAMGKNVAALEAERDHWKRIAEERVTTVFRLLRRNAGLKGALTRMKAKEHK